MSKLDSVGIAKQSAFGTKQTTMEYYYDVESATVDGTPNQIDNTTTVGYRYNIPVDMGTQVWKVGLNVIPRAASFPRILSAFFGAPTSSVVDTSGHKHSFDPVAASGLVYHSVLLNRTDPASAITDLPYDCAGDVLTISSKSGDFVKAVANLKGANNDDTRPEPTASLDATERYKWYEAKLYANIDGAGENEIKVSSWEFQYNTNLEDDHFVMGAQALAALPVGDQGAQLKFTLTEEDASNLVDWYRKALKLSSRNSIVFRINITGKTLVGASTQYSGCDIKLWNAEILNAPASVDAKNRLRSIDLTARANYDTTNSKFVTVDWYNAVSSY